jgi:hypothetical protein
MKLLAVAALALALCTAALGSGTRSVDVPRTFAAQLAKVKRTTKVPVLLPPSLPLLGSYRVYPSLYGVSRNAFQLELSGAPNCLGANACFIAMFRGERGGRLPGRPNARLAGGDPALFHPVSCGGSCAPSSFWFTHRGYLYSWQAKDLRAPEQAVLTRMANQAIAAGPR